MITNYNTYVQFALAFFDWRLARGFETDPGGLDTYLKNNVLNNITAVIVTKMLRENPNTKIYIGNGNYFFDLLTNQRIELSYITSHKHMKFNSMDGQVVYFVDPDVAIKQSQNWQVVKSGSGSGSESSGNDSAGIGIGSIAAGYMITKFLFGK